MKHFCFICDLLINIKHPTKFVTLSVDQFSVSPNSSVSFPSFFFFVSFKEYESLTPETNESSSDNRNKNYVFDIPPPPIPPTEMYSPYSKATAGGGNESVLALERRQAELEARAAELDRREKEQQARVNTIHSGPSEFCFIYIYIFCFHFN